ncbi:hypothetical protein [Mesonia aquimarina]|uniref:hypothetical protein n=1 Tax=Mesonia aquimarina TaxID=1504967 RepID=UPI000EF5BDAA|nr:hypothetical protein [Mesonia aquimarina]
MKNTIKFLSLGLLATILFACQEEKAPKDPLYLSNLELSIELDNFGENMYEVILIEDLTNSKISKTEKVEEFEIELESFKQEISADKTDYSLIEVNNQLRASEIKIERQGELVYHFKEPKVLVFSEELK